MAVPADIVTSELFRRAASAIVLIPVAVASVWAGMPVFHIVVVAVVSLAAWEWRRLCGPFSAGASVVLFLAAPAGIAIGALASPWLGVIVVAAAALLAYALGHGGQNPRWAGLGVIYLGLPATAMTVLRMTPEGLYQVLWLLVVVWAADTGAYVAGRSIGGPKLAPTLSPNKTQAGLLGGIAVAAAIGAAMGWSIAATPSILPLVAAALVALVAQGGDLFESAVKRRFGVKDAGRLIPGHGGVLDRIDGLLGAAPALALIVWLAGGEAVWR